MILDFDQTEAPAPPHADVCIVGAGAVGVALATELIAQGKSVVLLEGGGRDQEPRSQEIYRSATPAHPHRGIHEGRFRTYGGTTTRWGGQILELQPIDFAQREWVPGSGWPFPKTELTSYYERALHYVGLRRVERNDEAVWRELGLEGNDAQFARDALSPELAMMYSRWLPERNVTDIHAHALRESRRLRVYLHASVTGFRLNDAANALAALHIRGFSGRTAEVTADAFVLCLGAIETTRLLLQPATEGTLPWQTNGMLGKHYQDHIGVNNIPVRALRAQPANKFFGYNTTSGFRYHNKLWLVPDEQHKHRTLNVAGTIGPDVPESAARDNALVRLREIVRKRQRPSLGEALRLTPHIAALAASRLDERVRGEAPRWKRLMLTLHAEQLPLGPSAITLTGERDELGLLRTSLRWEISDTELHTIRTYTRIAKEAFARTGFAEIGPPPGFFEDDDFLRRMCGDSYHHIGGTRMSASADEGIVDPNLRLHSLANAYICSASVFPTGGYSNPTHTALALAMRLAERLGSRAQAPGPSVQRDAKPRTIELPIPEPWTLGPGPSQLGFGCAYLLGPGLDREKSRRLLDAAWDAGIRHFDAARLYGMGHTEALLGEFLAQHPEATVTTKFGVVPPTSLQRNLMRAQRLAPPLGKLIPQRNDKATFRAKDAQAALETSLRALRRERAELFLLHEAEAADLIHDDLLAFLHRKRDEGVIGNFGFGGEYAKIPSLLLEKPQYIPVLQFEHSLLGPHLDTGGAWCAYYRTFAPATKALTALFDREPETLRAWSLTTDADLSEPSILGKLLLRASLDQWPGSLQLFSTGSEHHIFMNVEAASDPAWAEPAAKLAELVRTRTDLQIA